MSPFGYFTSVDVLPYKADDNRRINRYVDVMMQTKCIPPPQLTAVHAQDKDEQKASRWSITSSPRTRCTPRIIDDMME